MKMSYPPGSEPPKTEERDGPAARCERPLRIGVFTDSYLPYLSGVVRVVETTSRELIRRGHQVIIFAPGYDRFRSGKTWSERDDSGIQIIRFPSLPAPNYPGFRLPLPYQPGIGRRVRELGLDIIHSHTPFLLGGLAMSLARRRGVPLVFTHHTLYHEYVHYAPVGRRLVRWWVWQHVARYCRQAALVIAPSHVVAAQVRDGYRVNTPVEVIPSGIDLDLFTSPQRDRGWLRREFAIPQEARVLINVGRLTLEKNPRLLLASFALLREGEKEQAASGRPVSPHYLVLVGDGPQRSALETEARELGIGDRVIFCGRQPPERVADALLGADLFLMASYTETQGLVVAEALAAGLPVVTVNSPQLLETARDGQEAVVAAGTPAAFAAACQRVLEDAALYERLQRAALARAGDLSISAATERLISSYRNLLMKRGRV
ncbi:MAG: glycosyltransferase [Limnochordales bacterium]|nr:glycosyltransferase [Limnochordales bacterium]